MPPKGAKWNGKGGSALTESGRVAAEDGTDDGDFPSRDKRSLFQELVPLANRRNLSFEAYYGAQLFTEDALGLRAFLDALATPTAACLRVQQTPPAAVRRRAAEQLAALGGGMRPVAWVQRLLPPRDNSGSGTEVVFDEPEAMMAWECSDEEYHARCVAQ